MDLFFIVSVVIKVLKLALNIVALILYRSGNNGDFLGVGGSWNINDEKDPDAEMVASGVMVGFFIYTFSALVASCLGQRRTLTDALLNFAGTFLWVAVGATALHYWVRYQSEYQYQFLEVSAEKKVGIALGALCVFNGVGYLLDTGVESYVYFKEM
ncbi:protein snakeskin-like [Schistocerca americana]|uniref:protein snakeskin-like n=1 Tax=Schistocerca americana TaxID=7009 RepID=UPI001F4FAC18|nr:protein snakeskin-like [Schistocerca americana]XP_049774334.1 protein snakeskin-like [Schistocerca cancellata]XP_049802349.1 protein snakeskin-like [Schistocerca nitens]XP_049949708.1 protein snakeskin-like [Schistocerca serialis cubense]